MLSSPTRSTILTSFRFHKIMVCKVSTYMRDDIFNYQSKYDEEQGKRIFKTLNESSAEDLSRISLSQGRLKKILTIKKNNGRFESFSDLLNIDGFGVQIMEKMCDSMLNLHPAVSDTPIVEKYKIKGKYLDPAFEKDQREELSSATGVFANLKCVGWARLERNNNRLTHWELYNIDQGDGKKLQLSNIMEIVWSVCQFIPKSDVYIMEAMPTVLRSSGADTNNPKTVHINLQKAQLVAMLSAALTTLKFDSRLSSDSSDSDSESAHICQKKDCTSSDLQHKVFYLRSTLPSRLFKTYIGNERVSAQTVIDNILNQSMNRNENQEEAFKSIVSSPVTISTNIHNYYNSQSDVDKENLCQTLMLTLTFMELCVHKTPNILCN